MSAIEKRIAVEKRIVRRFVKDALAAGHRLSVSYERGYDIDEMLNGSRNIKEIMDAAFAADDAHLFVHKADGPTTENGSVLSEGWVYIVLGNDGYDVISDYTTGIESLLAGANALADKLADAD